MVYYQNIALSKIKQRWCLPSASHLHGFRLCSTWASSSSPSEHDTPPWPELPPKPSIEQDSAPQVTRKCKWMKRQESWPSQSALRKIKPKSAAMEFAFQPRSVTEETYFKPRSLPRILKIPLTSNCFSTRRHNNALEEILPPWTVPCLKSLF